MDRKKIYQILLKKEDIANLKLEDFVYSLLNIVEEDMSGFNQTNDYSYFILTIPYFYMSSNFSETSKKKINQRLLKIRGMIQKILKEKKTNSEMKENYKILKKFIGKIEIISLTLANSYDDNFLDTKFELIYYLIFSIKNLPVLKNILKKAPHQINILDKKGFYIIENVVDSFLNNLSCHVKDEQYNCLADVIYYDRVLEILLQHNKEYINKYHIKKIDLMFQKAELKTPESIVLQERYLYFIYKWREQFQKYLNKYTEKLELENYNYKHQLEKEYMIRENFDRLSNSMAQTLLYQTKIPKVKSYMPSVFTVDGNGTVEIDDGFSCTKTNGIYHLGIHITNPMAYLDQDHLIFKNACKRVSSIYLKNKMILMFPPKLATDLFSLNAGYVKHAINAFIDIDLPKNKITKFEIVLEPVYIKQNDNYAKCNKAINTGIGEKEYITTLENIQKIIPFLKKYYKVEKLYASMKRKEVNVTATNIIGKTRSEQMIDALMVFMNYMYSRYASDHNIPILYRNNECFPFYQEELAAYEKMIKATKKSEIYNNEIRILNSNYQNSYYDTLNKGHFGLGLPSYTHITSPERRIADCINILLFQNFLKNKKEDKINLQYLGHYINERNRVISNFVNEYSMKRK